MRLESLLGKSLSAPILGYPNNRNEYILVTDASLKCLNAVLTQNQEGVDRIIAYAKRTLTKSQENYSVTKREFFAVV